MPKMILVPEEAVASILVRINNIARDKSYVREVAERYDGLKSFEDGLDKLGVLEEVNKIRKDSA